MSTLGGPILLKQGYMQRKGAFGWKRQYYRLMQDSLFQFQSHDSKTPTDEVELMGGDVEDGSWQAKKANCLRVTTERGRKEFFVCDNSDEHKQWLDAMFYATTVSKLAEYCSPLSGGWLHFFENKAWVRRWFMIKDSFLLCYNSREDVTPANTSGGQVNRLFVLPLGGAVIAYHKTIKPFSFSVQLYSGGELKNEFIFAAASEPIMNVWMEVLYVSTGKELPGLEEENTGIAVGVDTRLNDLDAGSTPAPSKRHREFATGQGLPQSMRPRDVKHSVGDLAEPEDIDHKKHSSDKPKENGGLRSGGGMSVNSSDSFQENDFNNRSDLHRFANDSPTKGSHNGSPLKSSFRRNSLTNSDGGGMGRAGSGMGFPANSSFTGTTPNNNPNPWDFFSNLVSQAPFGPSRAPNQQQDKGCAQQ